MSRIYTVIHAVDQAQVEQNLRIAIEANVDGVFLINHEVHVADLRTLLLLMRKQFPDTWIGVNYLGGVSQYLLPQLADKAHGLWMDGLPRTKLNLGIPVLGGVGFKYQHTGLTLEQEVAKALPLVDVLVTSGPGTGEAADPRKVEYLKSLAPNTPLGLASGLTPENVKNYLPWVDWLLVATGVSKDFTHLCPVKLAAFVDAAR